MPHTIKLRTLEFVQAARSARLHPDYVLARVVGVNRSAVTRALRGELQQCPAFIGGALTALREQFEDLFEIVHVVRPTKGRS